MKKRTALILLIMTGGLLSFFYDPNLSINQPNQTNTNGINFYLENLETRSFNAAGIHTNTLTSPYATEFIGNKEIELKTPVMQIGLNLAPWTANAKRGFTSADQKKITLTEAVNLARTDGMADINTERLVFDSTNEVAYTQAPVQIFARGSQTTADGVHINLAQEIIQLKNNVRTYYVP